MDWDLFQQVVEVRHQSFLNWDRSGKIATELVSRFPGMAIDQADPAQVALSDKEEQVTLLYGVEVSRITAVPRTPKSDRLEVYAPDFFSIVLRNLEVKILKRVGHRTIHHVKFPSVKDAENKLNSFAKKYQAGATLLEQTGDERLAAKTLRRLSLRFEDEKTGIAIFLKPDTTTYTISGPNSDVIRSHLPPTEFVLSLNIDVFTTQPLPAEDFIVSELTKSNLKLIRTRLMPLLESS